jgi:hypothetical protein
MPDKRSGSEQNRPRPDLTRLVPLQMREGDIVVTRVGRHSSLGRLTTDSRTQMPIDSLPSRSAALSQACLHAGADHRVFIWTMLDPAPLTNTTAMRGQLIPAPDPTMSEQPLYAPNHKPMLMASLNGSGGR